MLDGFYVRDVLGRDPYDGGSFHHSPVLLPFALVLEHRVSAPLAFALADLATTWLVHAIASYAQATRPRGTWNPTAVAAMCVDVALAPWCPLTCPPSRAQLCIASFWHLELPRTLDGRHVKLLCRGRHPRRLPRCV